MYVLRILCTYIHFSIHSEVVQLLSLNFGRNETTADTVERSRRYLVILEVDGVVTSSSWPLDKIKHVDTSVETAIAVADLQVLLLRIYNCRCLSIITRHLYVMYSNDLSPDIRHLCISHCLYMSPTVFMYPIKTLHLVARRYYIVPTQGGVSFPFYFTVCYYFQVLCLIKTQQC